MTAVYIVWGLAISGWVLWRLFWFFNGAFKGLGL